MKEETLQLKLTAFLEGAPTPAYLDGLNDAQRLAVMQPRNQAVQVLAGAGTGKTELISRRFVKLVEEMRADGIARPEERILVVTFTEDAAANMRARINQRLSQAGLEMLGPRCWISTFHQFCGRLMRAHSLEIGLAPDFSILNPLKQQVLFNRVVQGLLAGDYADISDTLRHYGLSELPSDCLSPERLYEAFPDQLADFSDIQRLRSIVSRIKSAGASPAEFYRETLAQVRALTERLKSLPVPHDEDSDGLVNIQLKLDAWRNALSRWAHESWDPVRETEEQHTDPTPGKYKDTVKYLAALYLAKRTFVPQTPDFSALEEADALECSLVQSMAALYAVYQHALLRENACDFDDLINHSIRVLEGAPLLQEQYRAQFEHIIVDEFQDSNGSQLRLLKLLMRDPTRNMTVVGDVKQSIYGFRFAQPENMDLIFQPDAEFDGVLPVTVPLQVNYRSRPAILQAANRLTQSLTGDDAQQLLVRPDWREAPCAPVQWLQLGLTDEDTTKKEPIGPQKEREAHLIAVEIARLVGEGAYRFRDIAILSKSHYKAEKIQASLARFSIPAVRRKNLGFFKEPVIKDAMALLRLMHNLYDDASLVRILQSRLSQRQIRTLMAVKITLESPCLFEALLHLQETELQVDLPAPVREAVIDLVQSLLWVRKMLVRPCSPARLFIRLSETVGIIRPDTPEVEKTQQRLTLRMFEKLLYLFSQNTPIQPTLAEVIDTLGRYEADPNLELPVAEEQQGEDAVQLMTIHGAKGLEFPVVFVAYTETADKRGPDDTMFLYDPQYEGKAGFGLMLGKYQRQTSLKKELYKHCWLDPRKQGEQQRLFYVALTRAQERLYVIRSNHSPAWTEASAYQHPDHLQVMDEQTEPETFKTLYGKVDPPLSEGAGLYPGDRP